MISAHFRGEEHNKCKCCDSAAAKKMCYRGEQEKAQCTKEYISRGILAGVNWPLLANATAAKQ